jgi:hypothetical protein
LLRAALRQRKTLPNSAATKSVSPKTWPAQARERGAYSGDPSLRNQVDAIRVELKQERYTRARESAEHDAIVRAREQKLEHLDRAIKNKAGELGAAIAQELV